MAASTCMQDCSIQARPCMAAHPCTCVEQLRARPVLLQALEEGVAFHLQLGLRMLPLPSEPHHGPEPYVQRCMVLAKQTLKGERAHKTRGPCISVCLVCIARRETSCLGCLTCMVHCATPTSPLSRNSSAWSCEQRSSVAFESITAISSTGNNKLSKALIHRQLSIYYCFFRLRLRGWFRILLHTRGRGLRLHTYCMCSHYHAGFTRFIFVHTGIWLPSR